MTMSLVNSSAISVLEPSSDEPRMRAALAVQRQTGFVGGLERAAVDALQEVGAVEGRQRDLGEIDVAAVGVVADDATAIGDRHRLQLTGGETVLLDLVDLHVAVGVGELRDGRRSRSSCVTSPSGMPLTVTLVRVSAVHRRIHLTVRPEGEILVSTFCHATCVPVAFGLVW